MGQVYGENGMNVREILTFQLGCVIYGTVFAIFRLQCRVEGVCFFHALGLCWLLPGAREDGFPLLLLQVARYFFHLPQKHWL